MIENIPEYLLLKYDKPVPRYTSYPPANLFREGSFSKQYPMVLQESNEQEPSNIAFYIHIPFCKKICFYCGCNSCTLGPANQVESYIKALLDEIRMVIPQLSSNRKVSQIHFGGGTPNSIPARYLRQITGLLSSSFDFIADPEIAIETNPAYLDEAYLNELLNIGFNRYSLGIQDFNNLVLKNVNRDPSAKPVKELMKIIKSAHPGNAVNLDFIYGLPGQSPESFRQTIETAAELSPDRLVTFSYAHVPWFKKHQAILEKKGLPGPEEKMNMFLASHKLLNQKGYKSLGLDHYVLPQDELWKAFQNRMLHRNFQGYCTRRTTGQVYAFGVSAISQLNAAYVQNTKDMKSYIQSIENHQFPIEKACFPDPGQLIVREVINELMCNMHIDFQYIADKLKIRKENILSVIRFKPEELMEFKSDGLLDFSEKAISITETGSLFIRNIAASLDPELTVGKGIYSKSV